MSGLVYNLSFVILNPKRCVWTSNIDDAEIYTLNSALEHRPVIGAPHRL